MSGPINGIREAATETLQDLGNRIVEWAGRAWKLIQDSFNTVVATIRNAFKQIMALIRSEEGARSLRGANVLDTVRTFAAENRTLSAGICAGTGAIIFCAADQAENSVVKNVGRAAGVVLLGAGIFMVIAPEALGLPRS